MILAHSFGFFNWCKYCLTVLHLVSCTSTCSRFAIVKFAKGKKLFRRFQKLLLSMSLYQKKRLTTDICIQITHASSKIIEKQC